MATRRRGRTLILVVLILILLLVLGMAAWLLYLQPMLSPAPTPTAGAGDMAIVVPTATPVEVTVEIVMLSQQVARGGFIDESMLTLVPIPAKDYVQGTFYENPEDVLGMRARYNLQPGTPLTQALLIGEGGGANSFDIPKGMVAISIPISKLSSVSYGLQPGDHVNMIASLLLVDLDQNFQTILPNNSASVIMPGELANQSTGTVIIGPDPATGKSIVGRIENDPGLGQPIYIYPDEEQRPRLVSQTLIQDVTILHVGIFPQGEPSVAQPAQAAAVDPNGQPVQQAQPAPVSDIPVPDVITIIVNPQDAITINYLLLSGARMNLVMRSAGDDSIIQTEPVTLQFVLDQYNIPDPAKLPYGIEPRTDNFLTNDNILPPFPEAGKEIVSWPTVTPVPANQVTPPTATPVE